MKRTSPGLRATPRRAFTSRRLALRPALCTLLLGALGTCLNAAEAEHSDRNLADLSLEELMNETVTSVSKREQKLSDAPAAIAVLSNEDLRRSGADSIPEALRLIPGMNIGSANAREWDVSARGFGGIFANKLLVLVDGRAVYSGLFGGVFWDLLQVTLADVDRVEVIRGPGATVWGANAVNGVINVVSRSARDTQGGLVSGEIGNAGESSSAVRYGTVLGPNTFVRVFSTYETAGDRRAPTGESAGDAYYASKGGFRLDHYPDPATTVTWQADAADNHFDPGDSESSNLNSVARYTHRAADDSTTEIQAYYDRGFHEEPARAHAVANTYDFTAQQNWGLGVRHNFVAGVGTRYTRINTAQTNPEVVVRHQDYQDHVYSTFIQDDYKLVPDRFTITAGAKLEHNDFTGLEFQPSVRGTWKPAPQQTVWAAVSRAVRTPDEVETNDVLAVVVGQPFQGPGGGYYLPTAVGNASPSAEVLWAYEVGYRVQPTKSLSVDLATFYNHYTDLIAIGGISRFIPATPVGVAEIPLTNLLSANSYGAELRVTFSVTDSWRLIGGYSATTLTENGPAAASRDPEASPPSQQFSLLSAYDFNRKVEADGDIRAVGAMSGLKSYTTIDLRISYRLTDSLEISLIGENLLDPRHAEQAAPAFLTTTSEVPRTLKAKVTLRF